MVAQTWDLSTLKAGADGPEFKGSSDHIGRLRLIILFDIIKTYLLNSRAIQFTGIMLACYALSLWLMYIIDGKQKQAKRTVLKIAFVFPCFCNFNCLQQKYCGIYLLIFSFNFLINK